MAMRCPQCHATAKTRTSVELSDLVRKSYHQCQNLKCGLTFISMTEIYCTLNRPDLPSHTLEALPPDRFPISHQEKPL
ncbi:ogr/Delta-like zinc finger family protein [Salmonella enterica]|nr:ogr/Delta-like zinc finger family protein [Salmonella enterica]ELI2322003.1 ogr/Delta-like zinc finger family protein [Salmonella enterica]